MPPTCSAVEAKGSARGGGARHRAVRRRGAHRNPPRARGRGRLCGPPAGGRRRQPADLRRHFRAGRARLGRHRHRRDRGRDAARRTGAYGRCAPPHARPARHRRRDLRLGPEARVLQRRLPLAVGPRRRVPRPGADQFGGARPVALGAPAARRARFPAVEGRAARGLPRARGQGAPLAPAGRPHHAGRHHAQSGRRRHLPVRRRHRTARSRAALRRADPGAGRDPRQSRRGGRGVRQRRAAAAVQSGLRADVAARAAALAERPHIEAVSAWCRPLHGDASDLAGAARHHHGDRQPRAGQGPAGAPRRQRGRLRHACRCRTAPRW